MGEHATIGDRLRSVRKRRGLTQSALAERSGVSVSLIRKLEQGEQEGTRLETARKFARVLRVETSALVGRPSAEPPQETDVELWADVRKALEGVFTEEPPEPPTIAGVKAVFDESKPLFRGGKFTELVPVLTSLLRDADTLVESSSGRGTEARRLRSRIRQMTAWLMTLTWQFEAADLAIRLALDDAPDVRSAVPVMDAECWRYIRQGDLTKAREVAIRWADDIEPRRISKASREDIAAWGLMLLRVSTAAVRDNRPGEADDALTFARMAAMGARRIEHKSDDGLLHAFGPKTVAMLKAENALLDNKPDVTLAVASQLGGDAYPLPWVWNRHRLDVAAAHASVWQYPQAVAVLQEIRRDLPEWLLKQRYARDTLARIVEKRRTLTPEIRELADFIGVPY
jgi:transcriptional regulator with XRE-family HTH domain